MRPEDPASYDVSLIITARLEGRLAHRSVRSAQRALRYAEQRGIRVELLAVLDRPTSETLTYFDEQEQLFDLVRRVDFCDRGLARNAGAELSRGRYLTFLDAGDLLSENWIATAFQFAVANPAQALVLHPELSLHFGGKLFLFKHIDSTSPDYSPLDLLRCDYWDTLSFVSRAFFLDGNRYAASDPCAGFGHAGWHWNCETIAHGAVHRVVPRTVRFARLKGAEPDCETGHQRRMVIRPTRLFDDMSEALTHLPREGQTGFEHAPPAGESPRTMQRFLSPTFRGTKKIAARLVGRRPRLSLFYADIRSAAKALLTTTPEPTAPPDWLIKEWRSIHQIEPELFPSPDVTGTLAQRQCEKSAIVSHYAKLSALIGSSPTHIFLLPFIRHGGADLGAIHFMTAVVKENPESRVVCLTTENSDSPWTGKLPEEVRVVEVGKLLANFPVDEQATLLLRLLLQKSPQVIHNIHSPLGFKLFSDNGTALATQSKLFLSLFSVGLSAEGRMVGYALDYLPLTMNCLTAVLTDNRQVVEQLCDLYGFEREKFSVIYFPVTHSLKPREFKSRGHVLNILWAGRIDREKCPEVLIRIASELRALPVHFHVYGEPVLEPAGFGQLQKLKELPNVTTYGRYDGFESIPATNYDLFLYTSQWDGLPNVLLEAVAAGLPVIAPDVGGVSELINDETGFLVSRPDAVDEYVEHLKIILNNYEVVIPKVEAARALVATRHSWNTFVSSLRQVPLYFSETVATTARS
jgi:glycosyltransferase involved in cell wall biosynthesis